MEQIDDLDLRILGVEFLVFGPPFPGHTVDQLGHFLRHGAGVVKKPLGLFLLAHAGGMHTDAFVQRLLHPEQFLELILGRFIHAGDYSCLDRLTRLTGLGGRGFFRQGYKSYRREIVCVRNTIFSMFFMFILSKIALSRRSTSRQSRGMANTPYGTSRHHRHRLRRPDGRNLFGACQSFAACPDRSSTGRAADHNQYRGELSPAFPKALTVSN